MSIIHTLPTGAIRITAAHGRGPTPITIIGECGTRGMARAGAGTGDGVIPGVPAGVTVRAGAGQEQFAPTVHQAISVRATIPAQGTAVPAIRVPVTAAHVRALTDIHVPATIQAIPDIPVRVHPGTAATHAPAHPTTGIHAQATAAIHTVPVVALPVPTAVAAADIPVAVAATAAAHHAVVAADAGVINLIAYNHFF